MSHNDFLADDLNNARHDILECKDDIDELKRLYIVYKNLSRHCIYVCNVSKSYPHVHIARSYFDMEKLKLNAFLVIEASISDIHSS